MIRSTHILLSFYLLSCNGPQSIENKFITALNSKDVPAFRELVTPGYISITDSDTFDLDESCKQLEFFEVNDVNFYLDSLTLSESELLLFLTESNYLSDSCSKINALKTSIKLFLEKDKIYKSEWNNDSPEIIMVNTDFLLGYFDWYKKTYPVEWNKIEQLFYVDTHESNLQSDRLLQPRISEYCNSIAN